jgi:hypothetical protein
MGVREWIKRHQAATAGVSMGTAALAVALVVWPAISGEAGGTGAPQRAFYSTDDGQTYFVDDADRMSWFDHEGKPAYRVYVFDTAAGEPFVGYIERLAPDVRARLEAADGGAGRVQSSASELEVKKPGEQVWHRRTSREGMTTVQITPPNGDSDTLEVVLP